MEDADRGGWGESFPRECLIQIFTHLPPASLAICMAVNKQWRDILIEEEEIWRVQCKVVYGYLEHDEGTSLRSLCGLWHPICAKYGVMALSILHSFNRIKAWLTENAPQVAETLRPGATEAEIALAETQLNVKFPAPLRILYRIHDGQELEFDRQMDNRRPVMGPSAFHGLFGGYSCYSRLVSVRMLPLSRMVSRTLSQRHMPDDKQVVFASTFDYTKLIHYDTSTGYIDVGGFPGILLHPEVPRKAWLPEGLARSAGYDAMPVDALGPSTRLIKLHPYIDLFFWMYDYANVLHREASMRLLHKRLPFSRGICLFPQAGENISTCITRGIRVKASPLFVPELSHSDDSKEVYFFAYSIEFKLLDEVTQLEEQEISGYREAPLKSVQLLDRRWITRNNEGEIESEVFGGGVIGEYPILVAGGDAFVYQSCTHIRNGIGGTMEGEFTFVEEPGTRQIQAKCDPFMLRQPRACF